MKKIIQGKLYDTETATEVHEWDNGYSPTNFYFCEETLFRTPKGAWFLFGRGGAFSKYSHAVDGGGTGGGWDITPLTPEEAREWLETHDEEAETIAKYFQIDTA